MSRPEHQAPPEIFYNEEEAAKYATSSRMIDIQTTMTTRALELLLLPERPCLLLDIGCGSGLSGDTITEHGHFFIGYDIAPHMLNLALEREVDGELMLCDAGRPPRFRAGTFDGAISISALQWLCNVDKTGNEPWPRLMRFFTELYACLKKGARAALQFYPETASQVETITAAALRCGFGGGLVVDYPHSAKAKKHYLVIYAGALPEMPQVIPAGLQGDVDEMNEQIKMEHREREHKRKSKVKSRKDFVMQKKENQRRKGLSVRKDTKYTARPRRQKF